MYAAEDLSQSRRCCLKILRSMPPTLAALEYGLLSQIRHPNLVQVFDVGRLADNYKGHPTGSSFVVLERVDGTTARDFVHAPRDPEQRVQRLLCIFSAVASALACLHRRGVLHGDVKPDHILVDEKRRRPVLLDFGLAGGAMMRGDFSGTVAYAAPEALAGCSEFRSDLYSLGAAVWDIVHCSPPFCERGSRLVESILRDSPKRPCTPWLPESLDSLIGELLSKRADRRPKTAAIVVQRIVGLKSTSNLALEPSSTRASAPPAFVEREAELERLANWLQDRAAEGTGRLLVVSGEAGVGKSALIDNALSRERLRRFELGLRALRVVTPAAGKNVSRSADGTALDLIEELIGRECVADVVLFFDRLSSDATQQRIWQLLSAADFDWPRAVGRIWALVECESPPSSCPQNAELLELGRLSAAGIASLAESMLGERLARPERLMRLCHGNPRVAVEYLRCEANPVALAHRFDHPARDSGVTATHQQALLNVLQRRRDQLNETQASVLDWIAVRWQPVGHSELEGALALCRRVVAEQVDTLLAEQLLQVSVRGLTFPSAAHRSAWRATIRAGRLTALHQQAAKLLSSEEACVSAAERVAHLAAGGRRSTAAKSGASVAGRLIAEERFALAAQVLEQTLDCSEGKPSAKLTALLVESYSRCGGYDKALSLSKRSRAIPVRLARARALQRRGDYEAAASLLRRLLRQASRLSVDQLWQSTALLAQVEVRSGQPAAAEQRAERLYRSDNEIGDGPAKVSRRARVEVAEVGALAAYYQGQYARARRWVELATELLREAATPSLAGRLRNISGMVAFARGDLLRAQDDYQAALRLARRSGDLHAMASYQGNLATIFVKSGDYSQALPALRRAAATLCSLGKSTEAVHALVNLAGVLESLGQYAEAEQLAHRARSVASRDAGAMAMCWVLLIEANLARRASPKTARELYEQAAQGFRECKQGNAALWAQVEFMLEQGEVTVARQLLESCEAGQLTCDDALVCRARAALVDEATSNAELAQVVCEVQTCSERLQRMGAWGKLWRLYSLLAQLERRANRGDCAAALTRARQTFAVVNAKTPELYRHGLSLDPDAATLAEQTVVEHSRQARQDTALDSRRLRHLVSINKRLNSDLDLPRLLEVVIDSVIELLAAERGFVLLRDHNSDLSVRVARNIDRSALEGEARGQLSRSIAEQAAASGEAVVAVDAATDARFSEAVSVSALRLRSALAVPLMVKGVVVGTIYVDHRLRRGLFGDQEVELMLDFAEQAAIAIENARLIAENKARRAEVEALNCSLRDQLEQQRRTLEVTSAALCSSERELDQRWRKTLIGDEPAMLRLRQMIARMGQNDLPVLIEGESGTGKELVARAIHDGGLRSAGAFVSENCAAIPETLLESTLFGHERGAFTGAVRQRRGLFEVARGGTLFLDEVSEMSPAMQSKLLRVLQSGEFRRVGGEGKLQTDARVISACNCDLGDRVASGGFRKDLFYRLNVVRIQVPALRERPEDIARLARHFLHKHGNGRLRITSPALCVLKAYSWPGNVRELENEIARAVALTSSATIGIGDLAERIATTGSARTRLAEEELDLHCQVAALERSLIRSALERTGGNQTRAASLLGLSRYGLQKKLRRYFGKTGIRSKLVARESHDH